MQRNIRRRDAGRKEAVEEEEEERSRGEKRGGGGASPSLESVSEELHTLKDANLEFVFCQTSLVLGSKKGGKKKN